MNKMSLKIENCEKLPESSIPKSLLLPPQLPTTPPPAILLTLPPPPPFITTNLSAEEGNSLSSTTTDPAESAKDLQDISRNSDSGKSSSCSPTLLDCSFDSGIAGVLLDSNDMQLHKRIQQCQRILLALEREREHFCGIRNRLSKISDRKKKKPVDAEYLCNVCCAEIDPQDAKTFVKCYICQKYICRSIKCADWLAKTAEWECELCQTSKESLAQTSSWVADQISFNQQKLVYPMRARSEIFIPISECNDSSMHFESVSQIGANSALITVEQKLKIREYVEEIVSKLLGGNLDTISVNQLSKSENYLPAPKTNGHHYPNGSIVPHHDGPASRESTPGPDFTDISEARLRNIIQKIIAETIDMPPLSKNYAVSEIALDRPSKMAENGGLANGHRHRHRTEHYFEPTIYQDLLATAVLNKIVDKQSNNNRTMAESSPDLSRAVGGLEGGADDRHADLDQNYNLENQSITSGSSVEPRSDCSYTDTEPNVTANDDKSSELLLNAGRDSAMSDYLAGHMVPLPDLSKIATESEEDDYMSVTSSAVGDSTWENNWLFKKKKPTLGAGSATTSSVGMLVPDPKEDVRAQIGDKTADEISDLSELGSDTDDSSMDLLRSNLVDPINNRLFNKHLIGGQNSKIVLDELIERSSMISNTLPTDQEEAYTETRNEHVDAPVKPEAINANVSQQTNNNHEDQKDLEVIIPPSGFEDSSSNPLTAGDDFSESEGCTGYSHVDFLEPPMRTPSVVEILAAIALGPMLAVPAADEPAALSTAELITLNELKDLALTEIKSRSLEIFPHSLGVIPEEMGEIDLKNFPTPDEIEEELYRTAEGSSVCSPMVTEIENDFKTTTETKETANDMVEVEPAGLDQSSSETIAETAATKEISVPAKSEQGADQTNNLVACAETSQQVKEETAVDVKVEGQSQVPEGTLTPTAHEDTSLLATLEVVKEKSATEGQILKITAESSVTSGTSKTPGPEMQSEQTHADNLKETLVANQLNVEPSEQKTTPPTSETEIPAEQAAPEPKQEICEIKSINSEVKAEDEAEQVHADNMEETLVTNQLNLEPDGTPSEQKTNPTPSESEIPTEQAALEPKQEICEMKSTDSVVKAEVEETASSGTSGTSATPSPKMQAEQARADNFKEALVTDQLNLEPDSIPSEQKTTQPPSETEVPTEQETPEPKQEICEVESTDSVVKAIVEVGETASSGTSGPSATPGPAEQPRANNLKETLVTDQLNLELDGTPSEQKTPPPPLEKVEDEVPAEETSPVATQHTCEIKTIDSDVNTNVDDVPAPKAIPETPEVQAEQAPADNVKESPKDYGPNLTHAPTPSEQLATTPLSGRLDPEPKQETCEIKSTDSVKETKIEEVLTSEEIPVPSLEPGTTSTTHTITTENAMVGDDPKALDVMDVKEAGGTQANTLADAVQPTLQTISPNPETIEAEITIATTEDVAASVPTGIQQETIPPVKELLEAAILVEPETLTKCAEESAVVLEPLPIEVEPSSAHRSEVLQTDCVNENVPIVEAVNPSEEAMKSSPESLVQRTSQAQLTEASTAPIEDKSEMVETATSVVPATELPIICDTTETRSVAEVVAPDTTATESSIEQSVASDEPPSELPASSKDNIVMSNSATEPEVPMSLEAISIPDIAVGNGLSAADITIDSEETDMFIPPPLEFSPADVLVSEPAETGEGLAISTPTVSEICIPQTNATEGAAPSVEETTKILTNGTEHNAEELESSPHPVTTTLLASDAITDPGSIEDPTTADIVTCSEDKPEASEILTIKGDPGPVMEPMVSDAAIVPSDAATEPDSIVVSTTADTVTCTEDKAAASEMLTIKGEPEPVAEPMVSDVAIVPSDAATEPDLIVVSTTADTLTCAEDKAAASEILTIKCEAEAVAEPMVSEAAIVPSDAAIDPGSIEVPTTADIVTCTEDKAETSEMLTIKGEPEPVAEPMVSDAAIVPSDAATEPDSIVVSITADTVTCTEDKAAASEMLTIKGEPEPVAEPMVSDAGIVPSDAATEPGSIEVPTTVDIVTCTEDKAETSEMLTIKGEPEPVAEPMVSDAAIVPSDAATEPDLIVVSTTADTLTCAKDKAAASEILTIKCEAEAVAEPMVSEAAIVPSDAAIDPGSIEVPTTADIVTCTEDKAETSEIRTIKGEPEPVAEPMVSDVATVPSDADTDPGSIEIPTADIVTCSEDKPEASKIINKKCEAEAVAEPMVSDAAIAPSGTASGLESVTVSSATEIHTVSDPEVVSTQQTQLPTEPADEELSNHAESEDKSAMIDIISTDVLVESPAESSGSALESTILETHTPLDAISSPEIPATEKCITAKEVAVKDQAEPVVVSVCSTEESVSNKNCEEENTSDTANETVLVLETAAKDSDVLSTPEELLEIDNTETKCRPDDKRPSTREIIATEPVEESKCLAPHTSCINETRPRSADDKTAVTEVIAEEPAGLTADSSVPLESAADDLKTNVNNTEILVPVSEVVSEAMLIPAPPAFSTVSEPTVPLSRPEIAGAGSKTKISVEPTAKLLEEPVVKSEVVAESIGVSQAVSQTELTAEAIYKVKCAAESSIAVQSDPEMLCKETTTDLALTVPTPAINVSVEPGTKTVHPTTDVSTVQAAENTKEDSENTIDKCKEVITDEIAVTEVTIPIESNNETGVTDTANESIIPSETPAESMEAKIVDSKNSTNEKETFKDSKSMEVKPQSDEGSTTSEAKLTMEQPSSPEATTEVITAGTIAESKDTSTSLNVGTESPPSQSSASDSSGYVYESSTVTAPHNLVAAEPIKDSKITPATGNTDDPEIPEIITESTSPQILEISVESISENPTVLSEDSTEQSQNENLLTIPVLDSGELVMASVVQSEAETKPDNHLTADPAAEYTSLTATVHTEASEQSSEATVESASASEEYMINKLLSSDVTAMVASPVAVPVEETLSTTTEAQTGPTSAVIIGTSEDTTDPVERITSKVLTEISAEPTVDSIGAASELPAIKESSPGDVPTETSVSCTEFSAEEASVEKLVEGSTLEAVDTCKSESVTSAIPPESPENPTKVPVNISVESVSKNIVETLLPPPPAFSPNPAPVVTESTHPEANITSKTLPESLPSIEQLTKDVHISLASLSTDSDLEFFITPPSADYFTCLTSPELDIAEVKYSTEMPISHELVTTSEIAQVTTSSELVMEPESEMSSQLSEEPIAPTCVPQTLAIEDPPNYIVEDSTAEEVSTVISSAEPVVPGVVTAATELRTENLFDEHPLKSDASDANVDVKLGIASIPPSSESNSAEVSEVTAIMFATETNNETDILGDPPEQSATDNFAEQTTPAAEDAIIESIEKPAKESTGSTSENNFEEVPGATAATIPAANHVITPVPSLREEGAAATVEKLEKPPTPVNEISTSPDTESTVATSETTSAEEPALDKAMEMPSPIFDDPVADVAAKLSTQSTVEVLEETINISAATEINSNAISAAPAAESVPLMNVHPNEDTVPQKSTVENLEKPKIPVTEVSERTDTELTGPPTEPPCAEVPEINAAMEITPLIVHDPAANITAQPSPISTVEDLEVTINKCVVAELISSTILTDSAAEPVHVIEVPLTEGTVPQESSLENLEKAPTIPNEDSAGPDTESAGSTAETTSAESTAVDAATEIQPPKVYVSDSAANVAVGPSAETVPQIIDSHTVDVSEEAINTPETTEKHSNDISADHAAESVPVVKVPPTEGTVPEKSTVEILEKPPTHTNEVSGSTITISTFSTTEITSTDGPEIDAATEIPTESVLPNTDSHSVEVLEETANIPAAAEINSNTISPGPAVTNAPPTEETIPHESNVENVEKPPSPLSEVSARSCTESTGPITETTSSQCPAIDAATEIPIVDDPKSNVTAKASPESAVEVPEDMINISVVTEKNSTSISANPAPEPVHDPLTEDIVPQESTIENPEKTPTPLSEVSTRPCTESTGSTAETISAEFAAIDSATEIPTPIVDVAAANVAMGPSTESVPVPPTIESHSVEVPEETVNIPAATVSVPVVNVPPNKDTVPQESTVENLEKPPTQTIEDSARGTTTETISTEGAAIDAAADIPPPIVHDPAVHVAAKPSAESIVRLPQDTINISAATEINSNAISTDPAAEPVTKESVIDNLEKPPTPVNEVYARPDTESTGPNTETTSAEGPAIDAAADVNDPEANVAAKPSTDTTVDVPEETIHISAAAEINSNAISTDPSAEPAPHINVHQNEVTVSQESTVDNLTIPPTHVNEVSTSPTTEATSVEGPPIGATTIVDDSTANVAVGSSTESVPPTINSHSVEVPEEPINISEATEINSNAISTDPAAEPVPKESTIDNLEISPVNKVYSRPDTESAGPNTETTSAEGPAIDAAADVNDPEANVAAKPSTDSTVDVPDETIHISAAAEINSNAISTDPSAEPVPHINVHQNEDTVSQESTADNLTIPPTHVNEVSTSPTTEATSSEGPAIGTTTIVDDSTANVAVGSSTESVPPTINSHSVEVPEEPINISEATEINNNDISPNSAAEPVPVMNVHPTEDTVGNMGKHSTDVNEGLTTETSSNCVNTATENPPPITMSILSTVDSHSVVVPEDTVNESAVAEINEAISAAPLVELIPTMETPTIEDTVPQESTVEQIEKLPTHISEVSANPGTETTESTTEVPALSEDVTATMETIKIQSSTQPTVESTESITASMETCSGENSEVTTVINARIIDVSKDPSNESIPVMEIPPAQESVPQTLASPDQESTVERLEVPSTSTSKPIITTSSVKLNTETTVESSSAEILAVSQLLTSETITTADSIVKSAATLEAPADQQMLESVNNAEDPIVDYSLANANMEPQTDQIHSTIESSSIEIPGISNNILADATAEPVPVVELLATEEIFPQESIVENLEEPTANPEPVSTCQCIETSPDAVHAKHEIGTTSIEIATSQISAQLVEESTNVVQVPHPTNEDAVEKSSMEPATESLQPTTESKVFAGTTMTSETTENNYKTYLTTKSASVRDISPATPTLKSNDLDIETTVVTATTPEESPAMEIPVESLTQPIATQTQEPSAEPVSTEEVSPKALTESVDQTPSEIELYASDQPTAAESAETIPALDSLAVKEVLGTDTCPTESSTATISVDPGTSANDEFMSKLSVPADIPNAPFSESNAEISTAPEKVSQFSDPETIQSPVEESIPQPSAASTTEEPAAASDTKATCESVVSKAKTSAELLPSVKDDASKTPITDLNNSSFDESAVRTTPEPLEPASTTIQVTDSKRQDIPPSDVQKCPIERTFAEISTTSDRITTDVKTEVPNQITESIASPDTPPAKSSDSIESATSKPELGQSPTEIPMEISVHESATITEPGHTEVYVTSEVQTSQETVEDVNALIQTESIASESETSTTLEAQPVPVDCAMSAVVEPAKEPATESVTGTSDPSKNVPVVEASTCPADTISVSEPTIEVCVPETSKATEISYTAISSSESVQEVPIPEGIACPTASPASDTRSSAVIISAAEPSVDIYVPETSTCPAESPPTDASALPISITDVVVPDLPTCPSEPLVASKITATGDVVVSDPSMEVSDIEASACPVSETIIDDSVSAASVKLSAVELSPGTSLESKLATEVPDPEEISAEHIPKQDTDVSVHETLSCPAESPEIPAASEPAIDKAVSEESSELISTDAATDQLSSSSQTAAEISVTATELNSATSPDTKSATVIATDTLATEKSSMANTDENQLQDLSSADTDVTASAMSLKSASVVASIEIHTAGGSALLNTAVVVTDSVLDSTTALDEIVSELTTEKKLPKRPQSPQDSVSEIVSPAVATACTFSGTPPETLPVGESTTLEESDSTKLDNPALASMTIPVEVGSDVPIGKKQPEGPPSDPLSIEPDITVALVISSEPSSEIATPVTAESSGNPLETPSADDITTTDEVSTIALGNPSTEPVPLPVEIALNVLMEENHIEVEPLANTDSTPLPEEHDITVDLVIVSATSENIPGENATSTIPSNVSEIIVTVTAESSGNTLETPPAEYLSTTDEVSTTAVANTSTESVPLPQEIAPVDIAPNVPIEEKQSEVQPLAETELTPLATEPDITVDLVIESATSENFQAENATSTPPSNVSQIVVPVTAESSGNPLKTPPAEDLNTTEEVSTITLANPSTESVPLPVEKAPNLPLPVEITPNVPMEQKHIEVQPLADTESTPLTTETDITVDLVIVSSPSDNIPGENATTTSSNVSEIVVPITAESSESLPPLEDLTTTNEVFAITIANPSTESVPLPVEIAPNVPNDEKQPEVQPSADIQSTPLPTDPDIIVDLVIESVPSDIKLEETTTSIPPPNVSEISVPGITESSCNTLETLPVENLTATDEVSTITLANPSTESVPLPVKTAPNVPLPVDIAPNLTIEEKQPEVHPSADTQSTHLPTEPDITVDLVMVSTPSENISGENPVTEESSGHPLETLPTEEFTTTEEESTITQETPSTESVPLPVEIAPNVHKEEKPIEVQPSADTQETPSTESVPLPVEIAPNVHKEEKPIEVQPSADTQSTPMPKEPDIKVDLVIVSTPPENLPGKNTTSTPPLDVSEIVIPVPEESSGNTLETPPVKDLTTTDEVSTVTLVKNSTESVPLPVETAQNVPTIEEKQSEVQPSADTQSTPLSTDPNIAVDLVIESVPSEITLEETTTPTPPSNVSEIVVPVNAESSVILPPVEDLTTTDEVSTITLANTSTESVPLPVEIAPNVVIEEKQPEVILQVDIQSTHLPTDPDIILDLVIETVPSEITPEKTTTSIPPPNVSEIGVLGIAESSRNILETPPAEVLTTTDEVSVTIAKPSTESVALPVEIAQNVPIEEKQPEVEPSADTQSTPLPTEPDITANLVIEPVLSEIMLEETTSMPPPNVSEIVADSTTTLATPIADSNTSTNVSITLSAATNNNSERNAAQQFSIIMSREELSETHTTVTSEPLPPANPPNAEVSTDLFSVSSQDMSKEEIIFVEELNSPTLTQQSTMVEVDTETESQDVNEETEMASGVSDYPTTIVPPLDQLSTNSTSQADDSSQKSSTEEEFILNDDNEMDILVDKFNKSSITTTKATTTNITTTTTNTTTTTTSSNNTNTTTAPLSDKLTTMNAPSRNTNNNPSTNHEQLTRAVERTFLSATSTCINNFGQHVANGSVMRYIAVDVVDDDDDDQVTSLPHFVPGSIAEREYKKWYNAVEMPNNPYAPEALKRRISGSQERFIDLPNISPSTEQCPLEMITKAKMESDEVDKRESDYRRYSRDYYINDSSKSSQISSPVRDTPKDAAIEIKQEPVTETFQTLSQTTTQTEGELVLDLYKAIPAQVVEDSTASSLETMSQQSIQSGATTTSDDSDTIKIYDFKKQETTTIARGAKDQPKTDKEVKEDQPAVIKERPTVLNLDRQENTPAVSTTPVRGSTPSAFKFLQPKRKLLDPSQVLSVEEDDPQAVGGSVDKPVIEKEVVKALPSVKALAKAFLMTSSSIHQTSTERMWPRKARTVLAANSLVVPAKPLETPTADVDKSEEDITICSDLSSLETDPSSTCVKSENTKDQTTSPPPPPAENTPSTTPTTPAGSATTPRQGVLKSNIAFFENLKFK